MEEHLNATPPIDFIENGKIKAHETFLPSDISNLLQGGVAASKLGETELAKRLFLKVTSLEPNNETALLWLASISEQAQERLEYLKMVLTVNPMNERANSWVKLTKDHISGTLVEKGTQSIKENNNTAALQFLLQAVDFAPHNEAAWINLSSIAETPEDKLAYLQRVLNINPANDQVRELFDMTKEQLASDIAIRGIEAAKAGDIKLASEILQDALDYDPDAEAVWLLQEYVFDALEEEERARNTSETNQNDSDLEQNVSTEISETSVSPASEAEEIKVNEVEKSEISLISIDEETSTPSVSQTLENAVSEINVVPEDTGSVLENTASESLTPDAPVSKATHAVSSDVLSNTSGDTLRVVNAKPTDNAKQTKEEDAWVCPVCQAESQPIFDICSSCHSMLVLDNIDMLLANEYANESLIRDGIQKLKRSFKFDISAGDYYKLGLAYLNLKDLKESIAFFQASHRLDNTNDFLAGRIEYLLQRRDGITQPTQSAKVTPFFVIEEPKPIVSASSEIVEQTTELKNIVDAKLSLDEAQQATLKEPAGDNKLPVETLAVAQQIDVHPVLIKPDLSHEEPVQDQIESKPSALLEEDDDPLDLFEFEPFEENIESSVLAAQETRVENEPVPPSENTATYREKAQNQSKSTDLLDSTDQTESHGWPLPKFEEVDVQSIIFANTQLPMIESAVVQAFSAEGAGEAFEPTPEQISLDETVIITKAEASQMLLSDYEDDDDILVDVFFSDEEDSIEVVKAEAQIKI